VLVWCREESARLLTEDGERKPREAALLSKINATTRG
jgi:hypothetical protein